MQPRYIKFDTFHPAVENGLPVTRVISRVKLQEILADSVVRCVHEGARMVLVLVPRTRAWQHER